MSYAQRSQAKTRMFARVVGPFLAIVAVTAAARAADLQPLVSEFAANPLWAWVAGAFTLLAGLVVVGLHPYWRGAAAIIVSGLGWLTTLKGLFIMAFPGTTTSVADTAIDAVNWLRPVYIVFALLGLYLTYVGWAPTRSHPAPQAARPARDLPHAA